MRHVAGYLCLLLMVPIAVPGATGASLPASCGPMKAAVKVQLKTDHGKLAFVPAGEARVVFVQQLDVCGGCGMTKVGLDGKWVGSNRATSWFAITVPAGKHHVCALWNFRGTPLTDRVRLTDFNAEAGRTYYFETSALNPRVGVSRLRMTAISGDEGAFLVSRSKLSVAKF